jgi:hypothetical protein
MGLATKTGILSFAAVILLGPIYSVDVYNVAANTISELGAQATRNNFLAISGFVAFGSGICIDWLRHQSWRTVAFLIFGLCVAAAGLFPHKPIGVGIPYDARIHEMHSVLASAGGVAVTVGFIVQGIAARDWRTRSLAFYLAAICVLMPMAMFAWPDYQGLIQRAMYLQVFAWLWFYFPEKGQPPPDGTSPSLPGRGV